VSISYANALRLVEQHSEKYVKKLFGRTDLEDALKRLDKLTHDEGRMITAEVLKATHTVDERVRGVVDDVLRVDDRVARVDERVGDVDDKVTSVGEQVVSVDNRLLSVDNRVIGIDVRVEGVAESVTAVDHRVAGVDDRVIGIGDRVREVDDKVAVVIDRTQTTFHQSLKLHLTLTLSLEGNDAKELTRQIVNDVDHVKRSSFSDFISGGT